MHSDISVTEEPSQNSHRKLRIQISLNTSNPRTTGLLSAVPALSRSSAVWLSAVLLPLLLFCRDSHSTVADEEFSSMLIFLANN